MSKYQEYKVNFFEDNLSNTEAVSQKLLKKIVELIADTAVKDVNELYSSVKSVKYSGQAFIESVKEYDKERHKIYSVGYLCALVDLLQSYEGKVRCDKEILKIRTKYRDLLLYTLGIRGILFHKDLAAALGVSASGLHAIIKQINATSVKLVNIEQVSKFKLYSLTPLAYQYLIKNNIYNYLDKNRQKNEKIYLSYKNIEAETEKYENADFDYWVGTSAGTAVSMKKAELRLPEIFKKEQRKKVFTFSTSTKMGTYTNDCKDRKIATG